jgi:hypothetical protein
MPHVCFVFFLFLSISTQNKVAAQDSLFVRVARQQAIATYEQATRKQAHVYDGNEYIAHNHQIQGHPFYSIDSLQAGAVTYNGIYYKGVSMQYDIVRDQLVVQPVGSGFKVRLHNEQVSRFAINANPFIRLVAPTEGGSAIGLTTGFYEMLYDGKTKALARRIKTIHEDISSGAYKADFLQKDRFFILKEGSYRDANSKGAILSIFKDQSKELRKYIRANDLIFKGEQLGTALTQLARHYDELTR